MKKPICFTALMLIYLIIPSIVKAETIFIAPSEVASPGVAEKFTIDVIVEEAKGLFCFEFDLSYDAEFLKFVSATEGDFLKATGATFATSIVYGEQTMDGGLGTMKMGVSKLGGAGINGDGILAKVEFEVIKEVSKPIPLAFKQASLCDDQLIKKASEETIGGKIIPSVALEPPLPSEAISPQEDVIQILTPLLKWSHSEMAFSYALQIAKDKEFAEIIIDQEEITETQYEVPENQLEDLSTYYWRVKAVNSAGESDWSEVSVFKVVTEFPRWDVNADGVVDISDLALVGIHFGEDYRTITAIAALSEAGVFSGEKAEVRIDAQNKVGIQSMRLLRVDINVEPSENLYGCQFDLLFDTKVLEVVGVKSGNALAKDGANTYWNVSEIDNETGKIVGATYVRKATKNGINTSGTLATVIFEVKDINISGATRLSLSNVKLADASARSIKAVTESTLLNWEELLVPEKSRVLPNYPNPFNPETWIPYNLARDAPVTIQIYNTKGRLIRILDIGLKKAGIYLTKERAVYWDGRDSLGEKVASGVYFYTLQAGEFRSSRKMVILK
ncbi:T9SS type A sorting domain-containing protein [bacterium]|nr:T9SS type A sorting domain-containing protein [bacterium]